MRPLPRLPALLAQLCTHPLTDPEQWTRLGVSRATYYRLLSDLTRLDVQFSTPGKRIDSRIRRVRHCGIFNAATLALWYARNHTPPRSK